MRGHPIASNIINRRVETTLTFKLETECAVGSSVLWQRDFVVGYPLGALYKTCEVARVGQMATLRLRRNDEVGERDGEYRHADEESVCDPLHALFGLSPICRRRQPSANDRGERLVYFHIAGSLTHCSRAYPRGCSSLARIFTPRNLCSLPDAAVARKDHNSEQYLAVINN